MKSLLRNKSKYNFDHGHALDNETVVKVKETVSESTKISKGISITGQVEGTQDFYINGELEGNMNSTAQVTIGEFGRFKGELKAKKVVIEGCANGKITANERIEVRRCGEFRGEVTTASIMISDKAYFQGKITMVRKKDKSSTADTTTQKTKTPEKLQEKKTEIPKKPEQEIKVQTNVVTDKQSSNVKDLKKK